MTTDSTSVSLTDGLRALIAQLSPGDRLPSSRDLVRRYRVSPVTVSRVIAQLAAEGIVVTRPGSGTYVAVRHRRDNAAGDTGWQTVALTDRAVDTRLIGRRSESPPPGTIMLDGGYIHRSLQPARALGGALARAARRPDAWDRAPASGITALRTALADIVGGDVTSDDVLITAGGQSALSMTFRAIAGPGAPVLVESPTYPGALAAAAAAGLRPVPVPTDSDGLRPDLLAEAFSMTGARALYCQPAFQNPTGAVLTPQRRRQAVEIARAHGAFLIEDDFARFLSHRGPAPRPLVTDDRDGTVIYLTSLTKPAAPSLRIAGLVARGPVMERIQAVRLVDDFFVTRPLQEAALELISSPAWERHVRSLAVALGERCEALAAAVSRERPDWTIHRVPNGGLHLWIQLPHGTDDARIADAAYQRGVAVGTGRRFFPTEPPATHLRLAFAAAGTAAELADGVSRLTQI